MFGYCPTPSLWDGKWDLVWPPPTPCQREQPAELSRVFYRQVSSQGRADPHSTPAMLAGLNGLHRAGVSAVKAPSGAVKRLRPPFSFGQKSPRLLFLRGWEAELERVQGAP